MAKSSSLLTRIAAIPGLLLVRAFEGLITLVQGRAAFLDPRDFAWVGALEAGCPRIQAELAALLGADAYIPDFKDVSVELAEPITRGTAWKTFFFHAYGHADARNCARCPETASLLEQIPGMTTGFFSILAPGTRLTPHRGPYKGVLRYHLALRVPKDREKCGIRVGGETRHWETGHSLVFDDTHEHEAWNDSDEPRVVLFVDFLRPLPAPLDTVNRGLVRLIAASPFIKNMIANLDALPRETRPAAGSS